MASFVSGIALSIVLVKNVPSTAETKKKALESGVDPGHAVINDKESSSRITFKHDGQDHAVPIRIWAMELKDPTSVKLVVVCQHSDIGRSVWAEQNLCGVILVIVSLPPYTTDD